MYNQTQLEAILEEADVAYRTGTPNMSDQEYDTLYDELKEKFPTSALLQKKRSGLPNDRKVKIPVLMASMEKIKTIGEYNQWLTRKNISGAITMIITGKYDGISLAVDERNGRSGPAWTGGDEEGFGLFVPEHYKKLFGSVSDRITEKSFDFHSLGEAIMRRDTFNDLKEKGILVDKNGKPYENPRNFVAGKFFDKDVSDLLIYVNFIRYSIVDSELSKSEQIDFLNEHVNGVRVPYVTIKASDITEDYLNNLFKEWNVEYELDGLIIDVNDPDIRNLLGRETSSENPCYARAFKGAFEDQAPTKLKEIRYQISKRGYYKPVMTIDPPVRLNGVTVTNVFVDNARFVDDYGLIPESELIVKRSGMVIPRIVEIDGVIIPDAKAKEEIKQAAKELRKHITVDFPKNCSHCQSELTWDINEVELMCSNADCPGSQLQRIISFFEILQVRDVSDGICERLYDAGYDTIKKILDMSVSDFSKIEGFGKTKAENTYANIHDKLKSVPLEKIQHASGYFGFLGSKKLALVKHFKVKPTQAELVAVPGFAAISAETYLKGYDKFWSFIKDLPVTIAAEPKVVQESSNLIGTVFVFSGFRSEELEHVIVRNGGKIVSGMSAKVTHLVLKRHGSGSTKEETAKKSGSVKIMDEEEFKRFIKSFNKAETAKSLW